MTQQLAGKIALVTGASSGIGEATALALSQAGAAVVLGARREDRLADLAKRITDAGGQAAYLKTDVTDPAQVQALVDLAVTTFGGLDFAFNNAGSDGTPGPIADAPYEAYDQVMEPNVRGVWNALRAEIPALQSRGGGSIVNNTSVLGVRGVANFGAYVASKHAVEGFTKSAALELAKDNIRVNSLAPGPILTPMLESATGGNTDAFNGIIPQNRPGRTEEITPTVIYLFSDASSYVTGHSIPVGGGATAGFVTG